MCVDIYIYLIISIYMFVLVCFLFINSHIHSFDYSRTRYFLCKNTGHEAGASQPMGHLGTKKCFKRRCIFLYWIFSRSCMKDAHLQPGHADFLTNHYPRAADSELCFVFLFPFFFCLLLFFHNPFSSETRHTA